jgi:hypothetical protein
MSTGFLYFTGTLLLSHWGWNHKIGDVAWMDALNQVISDFPFHYFFSDGSLDYLINGLFWAALASGLCALRFWRKQAA